MRGVTYRQARDMLEVEQTAHSTASDTDACGCCAAHGQRCKGADGGRHDPPPRHANHLHDWERVVVGAISCTFRSQAAQCAAPRGQGYSYTHTDCDPHKAGSPTRLGPRGQGRTPSSFRVSRTTNTKGAQAHRSCAGNAQPYSRASATACCRMWNLAPSATFVRLTPSSRCLRSALTNLCSLSKDHHNLKQRVQTASFGLHPYYVVL